MRCAGLWGKWKRSRRRQGLLLWYSEGDNKVLFLHNIGVLNVLFREHHAIIVLPERAKGRERCLKHDIVTEGARMAKKILVMDDDPTIADLLREALADEGYETFMMTQSLRFYDAVREHKPDLILLDLMMQYLDGRDELRLMEMGEHKIPVIVVPAFLGGKVGEEWFRQLGVMHIICKPFDLDKLPDLVRATIGGPEERRA